MDTISKLPANDLPLADSGVVKVIVHKDGVLFQSTTDFISKAVNDKFETYKTSNNQVIESLQQMNGQNMGTISQMNGDISFLKSENTSKNNRLNGLETDLGSVYVNLSKDGKMVQLVFEADGTVKWVAGA